MEAVKLDNFLKVDKGIPVPLYYQIKQGILQAIQEGALKVEDMIPTEEELCEICGISRPTIRQALGELVTEGYLYRLKGKGTFVSKTKIDAKFLNKLQGFNQEMFEKGLKPSTKVINFFRVPGREDINAKMKLEATEPLFYLERIRYADDEPLVYVETYFPYRQFQMLTNVDFVQSSLYQSMRDLAQVEVTRVQRVLEAVNAEKRDEDLLGIPKGKAMIRVQTVGFTKEGRAVEYSVARYRGDRNSFSIELQV